MATSFEHGLGDIRVTNVGAEIGETAISEERHLVLIDRGFVGPTDNTAGEPNVAYDIGAPSNATVESGALFGDGSPLDVAVKEALRQDSVPAGVTAISPATESVVGETPENNAGTLLNYPIIEDPNRISISDGTTGDPIPWAFRYEHDPVAPDASADYDVALNPLRGETAGLPTGATIDYEYVDYGTAFQSPGVLESVYEDELAEVMVPVDSETVGLQLVPAIEQMQREYRGALGYVGAEPTHTGPNGLPRIDADRDSPTAYTDAIDSDFVGVYGPSRLNWDPDALGRWRTALPGVGGKLAGNDLTRPSYHDDIAGYADLAQHASGDELVYLREQDVMPLTVVKSRRGDYRGRLFGTGFGTRTGTTGTGIGAQATRSDQNVRIKGNVMSGTGADFRRTQQTMRVVVAWTLNVHVQCEYLLGRLTTERFLEEVEAVLRTDWREFTRRGIMQRSLTGVSAGGSDTGAQNDDAGRAGERDEEEAFFIELKATGNGRVEVATSIAPTDVVEFVDVTNYIGTPGQVGEFAAGQILATSG